MQQRISEFARHVSEYIQTFRLAGRNDRLLVATSGGADSVALLLVLRELRYDCIAAHCNFHLRGEESMRDEQFVRSLCSRLGIPCQVVDFDTTAYAATHRISIEMACRELRYAWFEKTCREARCKAIAVAHHGDDCVETMLLNLFRGSGLRGLSGIRPQNGLVIRPLLFSTRQDILGYLSEIGQDFVTDSTNLENDYARNRVRNVILPVVRKYFPAADTGIRTTLHNLSGCQRIYNDALDRIRRQIVTPGSQGFLTSISISGLLATPDPETVAHELLQPYGYNANQTANIVRAATGSSTGALFKTAGYITEVGRTAITVMPEHDPYQNSEYPLVISQNGDIGQPNAIMLHAEIADNTPGFQFDGGPSTAYFDGSIIGQPLLLRKPRTGDRFRPFGMKGNKKLSDYFNDNKFSLADKRAAWLLCHADGRILWLIGHRASAEYRVIGSSQKIIILKRQADD